MASTVQCTYSFRFSCKVLRKDGLISEHTFIFVPKDDFIVVFQKFSILLYIYNSMASTTLFVLTRPKLNFGGYLTFDYVFLILKNREFCLFFDGSFDFWQVTYSALRFFLHFASACENFATALLNLLCKLLSGVSLASIFNLYWKFEGSDVAHFLRMELFLRLSHLYLCNYLRSI